MPKSLFLDFDGVLVNNESANKVINHNITRFVSKKTKYPLRHSKLINEHFYPQYGHTTKFLNATKLTKKPVTIKEFNDFVYNKETMHHIIDVFGKKDVELYDEWNDTIHRLDFDSVHIFSNAPRIWIETCLEAIQNQTTSCICFSSIISVPEDSEEGIMKPHQGTYDYMTEIAGKDVDVVFVDDNKGNFFNHKNVENVLYGQSVSTTEFACILSPSELKLN